MTGSSIPLGIPLAWAPVPLYPKFKGLTWSWSRLEGPLVGSWVADISLKGEPCPILTT